jgi:hypothetical protein
MTHPARLLALHPSRPPREELAPQPLGVKGGHPYERRLQLYHQRSWEGGGEEAIRAAASRLGVDAEELIKAVAEELFARGSTDRPADDPRRDAERHWKEVEHRLVSIMHEKGLDLDLACSTIGLDIKRLKERVRFDPQFGDRLEMAWHRGTAKLHGRVWDMAMAGKERPALALLQARDPRFTPTVKVEISEADILRSPHFQGVLRRLLEVFSVLPADGGEEYRRGWVDGLAMARDRAAEELGGG